MGASPPLSALALAVACSRPNIALPESEDSTPPSPDSEARDSGTEWVDSPGFDQVPVLMIHTGGRPIGSERRIDAQMEVILDHDGTLQDLERADAVWEGPIAIVAHGSSSLGYPKLNYRIEMRDAAGADFDYPLLGLPAESDWVLHGPYCDKTLLRNALAFDLGRQVASGTGEYQPHTAFLELFIEGDYRGVYVLMDRVKRARTRLDLPRPAASAAEGDLSGGYILRLDYDRNPYWTTARGTLIGWDDPDQDEITPDQIQYLRSWFDAFEAMLSAPGWQDPDSGYPAWIDVGSFVDHYIVNELAHNIDAYRLSAYLYKDADADGGRLHAGPLWDFDRAWGNVNYCDCYNTFGWTIEDLTRAGYGYEYPFWWGTLLTDPAFQDRLRCRWEELRRGVLADDVLIATFESLAAEVQEVEPRDDARWQTIGTWVDPNWFVGETWREELDWLETWQVARSAWLDANMPGTCG